MLCLTLRTNIDRCTRPMLRGSTAFAPMGGTTCGDTSWKARSTESDVARLDAVSLDTFRQATDAIDSIKQRDHRIAFANQRDEQRANAPIRQRRKGCKVIKAIRSNESKSFGKRRSSELAINPTNKQQKEMRNVFLAELGDDAGLLHDAMTTKLRHGRSRKVQPDACHWSECVGEAWLRMHATKKLPNISTLRSVNYRDARGRASQVHHSIMTVDLNSRELMAGLGTSMDTDITELLGAFSRTMQHGAATDSDGELALFVAANLRPRLTEAIIRCATLRGAYQLAGITQRTGERRVNACRLAVAMRSGVAVAMQ